MVAIVSKIAIRLVRINPKRTPIMVAMNRETNVIQIVFHKPFNSVEAFDFSNPNKLVSSVFLLVSSSVPIYLFKILSYSPLAFRVAKPWLNASINSVF